MTNSVPIQQLEEQLGQVDQPDDDPAVRIATLNDLAWSLVDTDMKRALALAHEAQTLAEGAEGDSSAFRIARAKSLRTQGYLNQRLGKYATGLQQLLQAKQECEAYALDETLADVLDGMGGIHFQLGNYAEALDLVLDQLNVANQIEDKRRLANAQNNLAVLHYHTGDLDKCVKMHHQILQLAIEINYPRIACLATINLGDAYRMLGELTTALDYADRALAMSREANFPMFEVYAQQYRGQILWERGDTSGAFEALEAGLALTRAIETPVTETLVLLDLARAHRQARQPAKALEYAKAGLAIAQSIEAKGEMSAGHLLLSELFEESGDLAQALRHFKQHEALKAEIQGVHAEQRWQTLKIVHETETARQKAEFAHAKAIALETEIVKKERVEARLQRQLAYVRVLSDLKDTLLAPAESEPKQQQVLSQALEQLVAVTGAGTIAMLQNREYPALGKVGFLYASAQDDRSRIAGGDSNRSIFRDFTDFLRQTFPVVASHPDETAEAFLPWSLLPDEMVAELATGKWQGGPTATLVFPAPGLGDFLQLRPDLKSLLAMPLVIGDHWWGIMLLMGWNDRPTPHGASETDASDSIKTHRSTPESTGEPFWSEDEILLLESATNLIGTTLQRWAAERDLHILNEELETTVQARTVELRKTVSLLKDEIEERKRIEAQVNEMVELLEERVADRSRELAALYEMTILLTDAAKLEDTLKPAIQNICQNVGGDAIAVHLLSSDGTRLQLASQLQLDDQGSLQEFTLSPDFGAWLMARETPLMLAGKRSPVKLPDALENVDLPVYFGTALHIQDDVIGLLSVFRAGETLFEVQDVSLLITMAEQLGVIIQNQRLQQQAQQMVRNFERQDLARKLHDAVAQRIYSLSLFARAGQDAVADGDLAGAQQRLIQVEENALYSLREMRLLLYQLRPPALGNQGLRDALEDRLRMVEQRLGVEVVIDADPVLALSEDMEAELYYLISEALNNSLRHAMATRVELQMVRSDGQFRATIRDNGRGFDVEGTSSGHGLDNMRARASRIGGRLTFDSRRGEGTTVQIVVRY